jgi:CxxC motif-containing protein (DUF1111 family)
MISEVLQDRSVNLFSDFMLHLMGRRLADDIIQGTAGLHDGRTSDVLAAIRQHYSPPLAPFPPSEANTVIRNFDALPRPDQQAILDFLRSL